jgi:TetR/AcrR family transcriptional repressor of nem operon
MKTSTKDKLLKTAMELMYKNSYHSTGVDEICRRSESTKGSFYHHFKSKEDLTQEAVDFQWSQFKAFLDECFKSEYPPLERFRIYFEQSLTMQKAQHESTGHVLGCPLFALGSEIGPLGGPIAETISQKLNETVEIYLKTLEEMKAEGSLKADADTETLAWDILSISEGAMTLARIQNSVKPLERTYNAVKQLIKSNTQHHYE